MKIRASKCTIKEVSNVEEAKFLNKNHYQGYIHSSICYGLYNNNDELVCLMSFGKPRFNRKYEFELLRLCTKKDYTVYGGASKLLNHFCKEYDNPSIISYCNRDKFNGGVYHKLGFKSVSLQKGYHYEKDGISYSRQQFQRRKLASYFKNVEYGDYTKWTESSIMEKEGFTRVEDRVGQETFVLNDNARYYIYKVIIEKYTYIGQHKYYDINDGYSGSGTILKRIQEKYNTLGNKVILEKDLNSKDVADKKEKYYIELDRKENKFNVNIQNGGAVKPTTIKRDWSLISDATRKKMSESAKARPKRKWYTNGTDNIMTSKGCPEGWWEGRSNVNITHNPSQTPWNKGKKLEFKHRKNYIKSSWNAWILYNTELLSLKNFGNAWNKGVNLNEEHKHKLSVSHKGKHWRIENGKRTWY